MDNYENEFIDKYFDCYMGKDGSFLFIREHPDENILYVTSLDKIGIMCNDMFIANPDNVTVKGVEFEYACIQNKSLELDGEYGEGDYDMFIHVVNEDELYLYTVDDVRKKSTLSRRITKFEKMMMPSSLGGY